MTAILVPRFSIIISIVVKNTRTWTVSSGCLSGCTCGTVIKSVYISHVATKAKAIVFEPNSSMRVSLTIFIDAPRSFFCSWRCRICWWRCRFITTCNRHIATRANVFVTFFVIGNLPLLMIIKVPSIVIANSRIVEDAIITAVVSLYSTRHA